MSTDNVQRIRLEVPSDLEDVTTFMNEHGQRLTTVNATMTNPSGHIIRLTGCESDNCDETTMLVSDEEGQVTIRLQAQGLHQLRDCIDAILTFYTIRDRG